MNHTIRVTKWLKSVDLPHLCQLRQELILNGINAEIKPAPSNEFAGEKYYAVFRQDEKIVKKEKI